MSPRELQIEVERRLQLINPELSLAGKLPSVYKVIVLSYISLIGLALVYFR